MHRGGVEKSPGPVRDFIEAMDRCCLVAPETNTKMVILKLERRRSAMAVALGDVWLIHNDGISP